MKRTIFQRVISIFGLLFLTFFLLACPEALQVQEQQKVKVTFTVADSVARTVLPQASLTNVAFYELIGGRNGATETILVESFTIIETSVELEPGTWNFTLNAYNDSGENILQGKVQNKQINLTGTNQVSFSLSVINGGTGSIQITLNFPEIAGITQISTTGDAGSENFTSIPKGNFVYSKNGIASGDYFINFEFYRGDVLRTVVSELVLVRNGLTSSKIITLVGEDLKPIYLTGTVTINPAVSVTIGTDLTATYSGTETVTYQWNKDGSAITDATEANYTPNSIGSYTVTVSTEGYSASLTSASVAVVGPATTVPGSTLQAKLIWLANTAESYSSYILDISGNETIPSFTLSYSGKSNIIITLIGIDSLRTISTGSDVMFNVGTSITLVLDNNITLQRSTSGGTLVSVDGTLVMNAGSAITRGGVSVNNNATFTMSGGTISGNTVSYISSGSSVPSASGGGVNVSGGTFIMSGGTISGNTSSSSLSSSSSNGYSYSGGGVYVASGTFTMSGGKISGNTSSSSSSGTTSSGSYSGGGVYNAGTFTMSGGEISGNTSFSSSSTVSGSATRSNSAYSGGGVYNRGTFTMSGGKIVDNKPSSSSSACFSSGGGVCNNGTFTMHGGEISGNRSSFAIVPNATVSSGGGVYVGTSNFTMNNGIISGNNSSNGGGVHVNGGTLIMNGGTVSDNVATNGGGICISALSIIIGNNTLTWSGTLTMNGGTISGNNASNGGGVYVNNGAFIMESNGNISGNIATNGGGVYVDSGTLTLNNGTIYNNTASTYGGGVYLASNGTFIMDSEATISGNKSSSGGGVYNDGGTFTIDRGTISGNTATNNGGGVYGALTMSGGTIISNNTAANGGGVYGSGIMSGGTIFGNTAFSSGGGVYVDSYETFTKTSGTIYGYSSGDSNSNTVKNSSSTILNNKGHAVWVDYSLITIHKETTAGPDVNLSWDGTVNPPTFNGGWEY